MHSIPTALSWLHSSFALVTKSCSEVLFYSFIYPITFCGASWLLSSFFQLWIQLQWISGCRLLCGRTFSPHLCKYQRVRFLDHMVEVCSVLLKTAELSLQCFTIYLPNSREGRPRGSPPSPAFGAVRLLVVIILTGVWWHLVLTGNYLKTYGVKHLFMW
jgi:hypothetical protein